MESEDPSQLACSSVELLDSIPQTLLRPRQFPTHTDQQGEPLEPIPKGGSRHLLFCVYVCICVLGAIPVHVFVHAYTHVCGVTMHINIHTREGPTWQGVFSPITLHLSL